MADGRRLVLRPPAFTEKGREIMAETILSFEHVNAGYGRVQILNDLTYEMKKGEVYGVIGPNGCGKTTMFNALIGLIIPMLYPLLLRFSMTCLQTRDDIP